MVYSVSLKGVTFTIPVETITFEVSNFGLEAIVRGSHPSLLLQSTLEFLQEHQVIRSLNLSEQCFAFWVIDGIAK